MILRMIRHRLQLYSGKVGNSEAEEIIKWLLWQAISVLQTVVFARILRELLNKDVFEKV